MSPGEPRCSFVFAYLDFSNYPFRYQKQHLVLFPARPSVKPREASQLDFVFPLLRKELVIQMDQKKVRLDLYLDPNRHLEEAEVEFHELKGRKELVVPMDKVGVRQVRL